MSTDKESLYLNSLFLAIYSEDKIKDNVIAALKLVYTWNDITRSVFLCLKTRVVYPFVLIFPFPSDRLVPAFLIFTFQFGFRDVHCKLSTGNS